MPNVLQELTGDACTCVFCWDLNDVEIYLLGFSSQEARETDVTLCQERSLYA